MSLKEYIVVIYAQMMGVWYNLILLGDVVCFTLQWAIKALLLHQNRGRSYGVLFFSAKCAIAFKNIPTQWEITLLCQFTFDSFVMKLRAYL